MFTETVHLDGHIIDSGTLSKVLDLILLHGGDYEITSFNIGTTREAASHAEIVVRAESHDDLHRILQEVGQHGAAPVAHDAEWVAAPSDGVFPDDFYSTTNLESHVRHAGRWLRIEQIEMDCGVILRDAPDGPHALTVPLHRVKRGDRVLVHEAGVKVVPAPRKDPVSVFGFMSSEVSAERPKELTVAAVAEGMIDTRRRGSRILFVGGPAIIHTGAGPYLEAPISGPRIAGLSGEHPPRRGPLPRSAHCGPMDRRALCGQRPGDARHRVGAARNVAWRAAVHGGPHRDRPQPSPAPHQRDSRPRGHSRRR